MSKLYRVEDVNRSLLASQWGLSPHYWELKLALDKLPTIDLTEIAERIKRRVCMADEKAQLLYEGTIDNVIFILLYYL